MLQISVAAVIAGSLGWSWLIYSEFRSPVLVAPAIAAVDPAAVDDTSNVVKAAGTSAYARIERPSASGTGNRPPSDESAASIVAREWSFFEPKRLADGARAALRQAAREQRIAKESTIARELTAAKEPKVAKETAAAKEPKIAKEPATTKEPRVAKEITIAKEAAVAKEPAATKEPRAATKEPRAAKEITVAKEAAVAKEPAAAKEPRVAKEITVAKEAAVVKEPAAVKEAVVVKEAAAAKRDSEVADPSRGSRNRRPAVSAVARAERAGAVAHPVHRREDKPRRLRDGSVPVSRCGPRIEPAIPECRR